MTVPRSLLLATGLRRSSQRIRPQIFRLLAPVWPSGRMGGDGPDRLLDALASRTGGSVLFLNTPRAVTDLLKTIFDGLTQVVANKVSIGGAFSPQVDRGAGHA